MTAPTITTRLSWLDVEQAASSLALRWHDRRPLVGVYGVPQGGSVPAVIVAQVLGLSVLDEPTRDCLVVDDLVDSGTTWRRLSEQYGPELSFDALYRKAHSPVEAAPEADVLNGWVVFPWERIVGPDDAVVRLLEWVGEDPSRDGLVDTPKRVLKALAEMTAGYREDPASILAVQFGQVHDGLVTVARMPFESLCEHHALSFGGVATVAYLPDPDVGKVVGLSKLARLLDCYARRLQVQERLATQVAEALQTHLQPLAVGVILEAQHSCMAGRGVRKAGNMVTEVWLGTAKTDTNLQTSVRNAHHHSGR